MGQFTTTHWSLVLLAAGQDSDRAQDALDRLCQRYWYPLYAFVRRFGYDAHHAADLTQGFFLHLVQSALIGKADPQLGRFRTFLLTALKNYLLATLKHDQAAKRGGAQRSISFDELSAEARFALEPKNPETPETLFERNWAVNLLENTLAILEQEYAEAGLAELFACLQPSLLRDADAETSREMATRLRISESAIKVSLHRLRRRYRQVLRGLIASTVSEPTETEAELRHLFRIFG